MDMDGDITLLFNTSTGSHFGIPVHRSDTILQIKRKIERRQGIPIFYQRLNLPDHVRLVETTITHLTHLDLEVVRPEPLIDLFIRPSRGDAFFISLQPRNVKIRHIKEKIQQITGIPITSQTLVFNLVYLPNHLNFNDTGIRDYSILDLIIDWFPGMMFPLEGYNMSRQPQEYQPGIPLFLQLTPQQQFRPQPSQPSQQRRQHQSGPQSAHQRSQRPQHQSGSQFAHQRSQRRQHQSGPELGHPRSQRRQHQSSPELGPPRSQRRQHQSGRRTNSRQEMDSRVHQPPRQAPVTAASGSGTQTQRFSQPRPQHQSGRQEMDSQVHQPPPQAPATAASGSGNQTLGSHEIPDGSVIDDDLPSSAPESESGSGNKN